MAKLDTLQDNFNNNTLDSGVWASTGTGISLSNGQLDIVPQSPAAIVSTQTAYDATNSQVVVSVPIVTPGGSNPTQTQGIQCGIIIQRASNTDKVAFCKAGNFLQGFKVVGGVQTGLFGSGGGGPLPGGGGGYSTTTYAYWRIRENSGTFYMEYASLNTPNTWNVLYSGTTPFDFSSVSFGMYAQTIIAESNPGFVAFESVNPQFVQDTFGAYVLPYSNQPVTNETPSFSLTAAGSSISDGVASFRLLYKFTGAGSSVSSGSGAATILPAGTTNFVTSAGSSVSTGSAAFSIIAQGYISAGGSSVSGGNAAATVPVIHITSAGASVSAGSAAVLGTNFISANGISFSDGNAAFMVLTSLFQFEPPIVYDNPRTLPPPFPPIRNSYAKWQRPAPRGHTVLKTGSVYTVVDTPTVDQVNSADIAYLGGHIYTVDQTEAAMLRAAGFTVTGFEAVIPAIATFPNDLLFPALDLFPT